MPVTDVTADVEPFPPPGKPARPRAQVVSAVLPCVKDLAADGSQYVRTALAGVVMELAPALGKAATIEHLLPVFLSLLKGDFPDVRLNIIAKLDQARRPHTPNPVSLKDDFPRRAPQHHRQGGPGAAPSHP